MRALTRWTVNVRRCRASLEAPLVEDVLGVVGDEGEVLAEGAPPSVGLVK